MPAVLTQVGARSRVPVIDRGLALELLGHGYVRPDVIRADRAPRQEAGGDVQSNDVSGQHEGFARNDVLVTIIQKSH